MKKILITGIDSFTGKHLTSYLKKYDYEIYGTSFIASSEKIYKCDITDEKNILNVLKDVNPEYIIHLAGISFLAHSKEHDFYKVNTIGSINILDSLIELKMKPLKIILISSAVVYGNQNTQLLDESLCPMPSNHYGSSKYAMETLARNYFTRLNIIITRPFNYTAKGQGEHFLIPKIIKHFKNKEHKIELGNLNISREFNDISFICEAYKRLLESEAVSEVVNIASNRAIALLDVIEIMNKIANYSIEVEINPAFVRKGEMKKLTGSSNKLFSLVGEIKQIEFKETLKNMMQ